MPSRWLSLQVAGDALEDEGDQGDGVLLGEGGEDVAEGGAVLGAHVRRDLHAGEQHAGAGGLSSAR
jgi:hypothetical protein